MSRPASASAIRRIVELATRAPSIHNTQPWRWRTTSRGLELHADPARQLVAADPLGRNLVISCGASLHHALVAAAALGWRSQVERFPDGPESPLLARLTLRRGDPSETATTDLRAIEQRCTDRRRFTSWPVPDERLRHLAREAELHGTHALPLLDPSLRFRSELLVAKAPDLQSSDASVTAEQRSWVDHSPVDGIPTALLPAERPAMAGGLPRGYSTGLLEHTDREIAGSDGLIVLYGAAEEPVSWLAAGEGLSALWLLATTQGLSVVPLSQVIEVDETRLGLTEQVLSGLGKPLILVRIGWQAISRSELPRTSRRPVSEVLERT
jgi:nitroreductase family protein